MVGHFKQSYGRGVVVGHVEQLRVGVRILHVGCPADGACKT